MTSEEEGNPTQEAVIRGFIAEYLSLIFTADKDFKPNHEIIERNVTASYMNNLRKHIFNGQTVGIHPYSKYGYYVVREKT